MVFLSRPQALEMGGVESNLLQDWAGNSTHCCILSFFFLNKSVERPSKYDGTEIVFL